MAHFYFSLHYDYRAELLIMYFLKSGYKNDTAKIHDQCDKLVDLVIDLLQVKNHSNSLHLKMTKTYIFCS